MLSTKAALPKVPTWSERLLSPLGLGVGAVVLVVALGLTVWVQQPVSNGPGLSAVQEAQIEKLMKEMKAKEQAQAGGGGKTQPVLGGGTKTHKTKDQSLGALLDHEGNANMVRNHRAVMLGLMRFTRDFAGQAPSREDWVLALSDAAYLPPEHLPLNPFAPLGKRDAFVQREPAPLGKLAPVGRTPTQVGTRLGPKHTLKAFGPDCQTPGTLVYDVSQDRRHYVLYAIGEAGAEAVVVAAERR